MNTFKFEQIEDMPDHAVIEVDSKYSVVIISTDEGIIIDVYPKGWDAPIDSMGVHDHDVVETLEEG